MPNWVKNRVKMNGIADMDLFSVNDDGEKYFDFNKIIPMPNELDMTSGSVTDEAIIYYLTDRLQNNLGVSDAFKYLNHAFIPSARWAAEVESRLRSKECNGDAFNQEKMYELGKMYVNNVDKYGCPTWYEWCRKHWGCKWNATDTVIIDDDTVEFETAWSAPDGVIMEMADRFAATGFEWLYADEDAGSNCGWYSANIDGVSKEVPESKKEALELYRDLWDVTAEIQTDEYGEFYLEW